MEEVAILEAVVTHMEDAPGVECVASDERRMSVPAQKTENLFLGCLENTTLPTNAEVFSNPGCGSPG